MSVRILKSSAREKIQVAALTLFWMMGGLYFLVQGYEFFSFPWAWALLVAWGLAVCVRQWNQAQTTLELTETELVWKTFSTIYRIPYIELTRVEENVDRNRLIFTTSYGKRYMLGMGDRNYKQLLDALYERVPSLHSNLVIPCRIGVSWRYVLTFLSVIALPLVSSGYYLFVHPSWFIALLACTLVVFMVASLWSTLENLPLFYTFEGERLTIFFFFRKQVVIPLARIERTTVVLDRNGFWHCTLVLEDSSFYEISEVHMAKSLYLYFLFIGQRAELLKNA